MASVSEINSCKSRPKLENDTVPNCFLCLQKLPLDHKTKPSITTEFIQQVCKYFSVSCNNTVTNPESTNITDASHAKLLSNRSFSATLCPPCATVTAKLSTLIQELEVTQMQIDYQIQKFYQPLLVPNYNTDDLDTVSNGISQVRKNLKEKCKYIVKL